MVECGDIFFPPGELSANSLREIAGIDFLYISDASTHAGLDCYAIYVHEDTVFNEIIVNGVNCVTSKGLSAKTIKANTLMPFGKAHATSIDLTSGSVFALIY